MSSKPSPSSQTAETSADKIPPARSNVFFSHERDLEDDGKIVVSRTDGSQKKEIATVKGGVLAYKDQAARKHATQVVQYLDAEGVEFDPEEVVIEGKGRDEPRGDIPAAPRKTIEQGDKTPEYVEWLKKYKPKEYEARYGIEGPGKVTQVIDASDPMTGRPVKKSITVDATVARRKTHLTEKRDAAEQRDVDDPDNS